MPTRAVLRGRAVIQSMGWAPKRNIDHGRNALGQFVNDEGKPIDINPYAPPAEEGLPPVGETFVEEGVAYRVVQRLDPREGWAPVEWWLRRYGCRWPVFRELCQRGWFDAAIEPAGAAPRYRCRDEGKVVARLAELRPQMKRQIRKRSKKEKQRGQ